MCFCGVLCVCVPTEQREHLESTCPTHTLRTETDQVSISLASSTLISAPSSGHPPRVLLLLLFGIFPASPTLCCLSAVISAHLLCETLVGPDPESPSNPVRANNNNHLLRKSLDVPPESSSVKHPVAPPLSIAVSNKPPRLSLERSFSAEEDQQKSVECPLQPARVYTITSQRGTLMSGGGRGSKESLELDILKEKLGGRAGGSRGGLIQPSASPSSTSSSPTTCHHAGGGRATSHHHSNYHHHVNHHSVSGTNVASSSGGSSAQHAPHHSHHHHLPQPPLQTSVSAHNIRSWGEGAKGEADCGRLACEPCSGAPSRSQGSLDLESASREAGKQHRRLERMWSVERMTGLERGEGGIGEVELDPQWAGPHLIHTACGPR